MEESVQGPFQLVVVCSQKRVRYVRRCICDAAKLCYEISVVRHFGLCKVVQLTVCCRGLPAVCRLALPYYRRRNVDNTSIRR
jgi:hypothetical protein